MADQNYSPGDWRFGNLIANNLTLAGSLLPGLPRTSINQTTLARFPVNFTDFRIHDAFASLLPGTASSGDMGLVGGTFGTNAPVLKTEDGASTTITSRARVLVRLPAEYDAGETVKFRLSAAMDTNLSDNASTLDLEVWEIDRDDTLGASDLVTTSAYSITSATFADKDFDITATNLVAGDLLDVRVTWAITDGATGSGVVGVIAGFDLLCDIRG